ncbi:lachrymatory-factor synthase-like [Bidens hawaiensis]|uniref:lachrymatory-factor synthase-like n=1 Tax=Bidens hawaiensis TaxID=980011 RepID=UPI0040490921
MSQENKDSKWEGKSTAELKNIKAEQIWPLFEDFCTIHKWLPILDAEKCHQVEGVYGEPGLVRYVVLAEQSSSVLPSNITDNAPSKWTNEKLLTIDPTQKSLSYEITENNLGFRCYVANIKVIDIDGGCKIEWSFISDPVDGMRLEDLRGYIESIVKTVAEGMGNYLSLI